MQNAYSKLLCVDDEPEILVSLKRLFRGIGIQIDTADGGKEALEKIETSEYDVIISDMRMPKMDGATFLQHAQESQPEAKRILLTGYSDQDSTIRAINNGKIFSYVNKPWSNNDLREIVMSAIAEKYAETELSLFTENSTQEKTLLESKNIHLLSQMELTNSELELANHEADQTKKELTNSHHNTIKTLSSLTNSRVSVTQSFNEQVILQSVFLGKKLALKENTIRDLRYAAYLYQVGKITLPESVIDTPYYQLDDQARDVYEQYPSAGADILEPLGFLPQAADMIRQHRQDYASQEIPQDQNIHSLIPIGARILRIITDYNCLLHGMYSELRYSQQNAVSYLKSYAGKKYDPEIMKQFELLLPELEQLQSNIKEQPLTLQELTEGMVASRDIFSACDVLLVSKGTRLTRTIIETMAIYQKRSPKALAIFVLRHPPEAAHNDE